eukprot:4578557-Prymnesium_polylepis.1
MMLAQRRPQPISKAVENAAVAVSCRQGEWSVDGVWSYDFSKLGYACAVTSRSGVQPDADSDRHDSSSSAKQDVLKA